MTKEQILKKAIETLNKNQECYIAQWIKQNPDKNISDYTLCHQTVDGVFKVWLKKIEY